MYLIVIPFVSSCVHCTSWCGAPRRPWLHSLLASVQPVNVFLAAHSSDCQAMLQWWGRSDIRPRSRGCRSLSSQAWSSCRQKASLRASGPKRRVPQKALCHTALFTAIWSQVTAALCQQMQLSCYKWGEETTELAGALRALMPFLPQRNSVNSR